MRPISVGIGVFLGVFSLAGTARAADDAREKAVEHYRAGTTHYQLSEYGDALNEFKEAFRLRNDPAFLYNIAQCHRMLGQHSEALLFFKRYLRAAPTAPNRAEVEKKIRDLETMPEYLRKPAFPGANEPKDTAAAPAPPRPASAPPTPTSPPAAVAAAKQTPASPPPAPVAPPAAPPPAAPPPRPAVVAAVAPPAAPPPRPAVVAAVAPAPPASPPRQRESAFYQRWWFWTAVAAVGTGVLAAVLLAGGSEEPGCRGVQPCFGVR